MRMSCCVLGLALTTLSHGVNTQTDLWEISDQGPRPSCLVVASGQRYLPPSGSAAIQTARGSAICRDATLPPAGTAPTVLVKTTVSARTAHSHPARASDVPDAGSVRSTPVAATSESNPVIHGRYSTTFSRNENPISENGAWTNGKAIGLDFGDVRTTPGFAFGVDLPSKYADPTAVLTGRWGANQRARGTVRVKNPPAICCQEVELRLRTTITPHSMTGYEINCSVVASNAYLQIGRWNGPLNDVSAVGEAKVGCVDGDVLEATVIGSTITVYKNGVQVLEANDSKYTTGNPGIGFYDDRDDFWSRHIWNLFRSWRWSNFGFDSFSATDDVQGASSP